MAKKGIYSLKHVSLEGIESSLRMKTEDGKLKENFPLTTIDAITSSCENMEELLKLTRKLNVPKKNSKDEWLDGHFYIEYKNNHKIKRLSIVFNDNLIISELSRIYEGMYTMPKDRNVPVLAYKIIKIRKHQPNLYEFLRKSDYLDNYLSQLIGEYVFFTGEGYQNPNEADKRLNEIIAKLENYKIFREINVGIYNYNKLQELREAEKQLGQTEEPEIQKVKRIIPKGTQLKFSDAGYNF